jgi:IclR family transcriptional regulator, KDG regulon repressor
MVQVIERASVILEHLSDKGKLSLNDLCVLTKLKKPTLYVILKTLNALGYVKKNQEKEYLLGDKLLHLTYSYLKRNTVLSVAQEVANSLAGRIKETVTVAALYEGERHVVAKVSSEQSVIVNTDMVRPQSIYSMPTGRILLAYLDDKELKEVVDVQGLPDTEWSGIRTYRALKHALSIIKKRNMAYMFSNDKQAYSLAVPVLGPDGKAWASIGVGLPSVRFKGRHKEDIVKSLVSESKKMGHAISLLTGKRFTE